MSESGRMRRRRSLMLVLLVAASWLQPQAASAYGPEGHLIAGLVAANGLCERARYTIDDLAGGENLGDIGLWADRIRSDPDYADSAPWHYMNIETGESIAGFEHPPEGDVLWAINHFTERLGDPSLVRGDRAEALRFLVHFIVDMHQPLHVGLAGDRGGNAVPLEYRGRTTNLHRLWDTHAIEWSGLSVRQYADEISRQLRLSAAPVSLDASVWAAESLALRADVYDFGAENAEPSAAYLDFAAVTTRARLTLAASRLAATLNTTLC